MLTSPRDQMKVKKDKFLTQYMGESQDAPILETASRKNYGSGSKCTTATSASYTISAGSKVGGRIGNASRRGFMRARGTSVQKGTEASKKDPVASKLSHLLTKSKKVKHSDVVQALKQKYKSRDLKDVLEQMIMGGVMVVERKIPEGGGTPTFLYALTV